MTADVGPDLIDVNDYTDDTMTLAYVELSAIAALWSPEVRDEALETLGGMATLCAIRGAIEHHAVAEFLVSARRLIRVAGEQGDATRARALTKESD